MEESFNNLGKTSNRQNFKINELAGGLNSLPFPLDKITGL